MSTFSLALKLSNINNILKECTRLKNLTMDDWTIPNITSFSYFFAGRLFGANGVWQWQNFTPNLQTLSMKNLNANGLTNISNMFTSNSVIRSVDFSGISAPNITNMSAVFNGCSSLVDLNIEGLTTKNVTSMTSMFNGCNLLTNLDISNFNFTNVTSVTNFGPGKVTN